MRRGIAIVVFVASVASLLAPGRAGAAGVTTHSWMSVEAIDRVADPDLKALLVANREYVRSGAHFPDSGYALTNTYGEEAHWQRFHDAFAAQILTRDECTDLTAPAGPCAPVIAFLMGMIGHGMGDEVWDWLFEPYVADLEEYYVPTELGGYANEGGAELQLDLAAIGAFGQVPAPLVPFPEKDDILATFAAVGRPDVDLAELNLGQVAMGVVQQAEATWAPVHLDALHEAMPWTTRNMVTAPGGVDFAATAIAGAWNSMWGRLLGSRPATAVSITYPADGDRRIPASGWMRDHAPGSGRDRGGARTRVAAVLTYSRPYDGSEGTVSSELPVGSMTLVERDSGTPVPIQAGWPRSVPYGPDAGEHMIGIQPSVDLAPCTWYRAGVTASLVDARDEPVTPMTWEFRTGTDADGHRCSDDPLTADERFVRQVTADLLDRASTDGELADATYAFERGRTRRDHVVELLASVEERERLVTEAFDRYLRREPDPSGLAYWSAKLLEIGLPEFHARLLGSAELYRRAGSTDEGYLAELYLLVHQRPPDPSGAQHWLARLGDGLTRQGLAKALLTSQESAHRTVATAYAELLGRAPDPSGDLHWSGVLRRGADPRDLWRSIVLSAEYDRRAQAA